MLGLALRGAALVTLTRVTEGMRCLDEATATALAGEATIPISSAWACCFLVGACTAVRDYERAFAWCDRIAEFAARYGSRYMLSFCRAEYGAVHLWRGRWTDAEEMLEASLEDFSRSRPAMVAGRWSASQSSDGGRAGRTRPRGCSTARGRLRRRSSAGPAWRSTRAPRAGRSNELAEGVLEAAGSNHERARALLEDAVDRFQRIGAPFEEAQARIELATSLAASAARCEQADGDAVHEPE